MSKVDSWTLATRTTNETDDVLIRLLLEAAKNILPAGAAFTVDGVPLAFCLEVTCDGAQPDFGYRCALKPGHGGQCWSNIKRLDFTREN